MPTELSKAMAQEWWMKRLGAELHAYDTAGIATLTALLDRRAEEAKAERDLVWRDALAPNNADTDYGAFMLVPSQAAGVLEERLKLAEDEGRTEERERIRGIVGDVLTHDRDNEWDWTPEERRRADSYVASILRRIDSEEGR